MEKESRSRGGAEAPGAAENRRGSPRVRRRALEVEHLST